MPAQVHVFAPGSVGNVGPGLDVLGLAIGGAGDEVIAERLGDGGVVIADPGHPSLPTDPGAHSSGIAAREVLRRAAAGFGVRLRVRKGLPLAGGQGGSAASAVAGALATNLLLDRPLPQEALILAALEAEAVVAGRHADNIVAILLGGLVLIRSMDPLDLVCLPVPAGLRVVLAHPDRSMTTRDGRAVLPAAVPREVAVHQAAQVGAIVAAAYSGDLDLLGRAIDDRIAEPGSGSAPGRLYRGEAGGDGRARAGLLDFGKRPRPPSRSQGAMNPRRASGRPMTAAYAALGIRCTTRVAAPDLVGARRCDFSTARPPPGSSAWRAATRRWRPDAGVRCRACGGLLEVRHRPPELPGPVLRGLFQTRCCTRPDTTASGVWRFQELVMPTGGPKPGVVPGGQYAAAVSAADRRVGRACRTCSSSTRGTIPPAHSRTAV
jgi:homoserine kinase